MHNVQLAKLRIAIQENDSMQCEDILQLLMMAIGNKNAKALALKALRNYLPIFEATHPQVSWPRTFLDLLKDQGFLETSKLLPKFLNSFPDSNSNGFLSLLQLMDEATQPHTAQNMHIDLFSDIVVGSINLRRREYWAGKFPEDAGIAERSAWGDKHISAIQSKYLNESDVQAYTKIIWAEILAEVNQIVDLD